MTLRNHRRARDVRDTRIGARVDARRIIVAGFEAYSDNARKNLKRHLVSCGILRLDELCPVGEKRSHRHGGFNRQTSVVFQIMEARRHNPRS